MLSKVQLPRAGSPLQIYSPSCCEMAPAWHAIGLSPNISPFTTYIMLLISNRGVGEVNLFECACQPAVRLAQLDERCSELHREVRLV